MTRINIGINPEELCDQHLIAEYRELPRMRAFALKRLARYHDIGPCPTKFTLGTGHMAFFVPYGHYLETRWKSLCAEMQYRGFHVSFSWIDYPFNHHMDTMHIAKGRELLQKRITERLSSMKRKPTWTKRIMPGWINSCI